MIVNDDLPLGPLNRLKPELFDYTSYTTALEETLEHLPLPILVIACIAIVDFLASRIMAKSLAESWGAEVPASEAADTNWYQLTD